MKGCFPLKRIYCRVFIYSKLPRERERERYRERDTQRDRQRQRGKEREKETWGGGRCGEEEKEKRGGDACVKCVCIKMSLNQYLYRPISFSHFSDKV